jgi:hypothetical protein
MPEARQFTFTYQEIAEALVKQQGIHEGLWGVYVEFGIAAANVGTSPESNDVVPAAIVPIQRMGIQRFDEANNLTVHAAEVNPAPEAAQSASGEETTG